MLSQATVVATCFYPVKAEHDPGLLYQSEAQTVFEELGPAPF